jgi:hypothetical protein
MSVKVVTFARTLMYYAHELGQARLSGDPERIEKALREHNAYAQLCIDSDEMII